MKKEIRNFYNNLSLSTKVQLKQHSRFFSIQGKLQMSKEERATIYYNIKEVSN